MAAINVGLDDTFDTWRQKTNDLSGDVGDLDTLNTTDKTTIVAAVNETAAKGNEFSVAMAIALG